MSEKVFHPLRKYLENKNISLRAFCRIANMAPATIHRIINGQTPSLRIAKRICKYSGGEIQMRDFGYESDK